MQRISLINIAHDALKEHIKLNDIVIDATIGNGHDTVFLAEQVGAAGCVFGFDIQQNAIESTLEKFDSTTKNNAITLFQTSHAEMLEKIPPLHHGKIKAIMFNLGYLPGGDKSIITCTASTLKALSCACLILSVGGIMTVMAYPGHTGGDDETDQIKSWCAQLDKSFLSVEIISSASDKSTAPILFIIKKHSKFN